LNEQLKILVGLQEIDSSLLIVAEQIDSLPDRLEQYKAPLKEVTDLLQKAKTQSEVLTKKKKDKDLQLDEFQDKIDKLKSRSADVKTNKEYDANLKEIETFEKNRYKIEDEVLVMMEDIETFVNTLKEEEARVKEAEKAFKQEEAKIEEAKKKLFSEIETIKAKRAAYIDKLDKSTYDRYMKLLKKLGGLAVVEVKNEICLGCNTNIPPQLYSDIVKGEAICTCFFCNRLLYYKDDAPNSNSQEAAPASNDREKAE
jgi:predicted  nucleic acid-binding Zn-ribbon protein